MNEAIEIIAPTIDHTEQSILSIPDQSLLPPFNPEALAFCAALSKALLTPKYREQPELVALGFWLRGIRQASLADLSKQNVINKPLGAVVHFTPSNVDTMFIYSWICGLLTGNHNIVRVASAHSDLQSHLFALINDLFADPNFSSISARNVFARYEKNSQWSAKLSLLADARVLWGGDESVQSIRLLPTKPRAREVSFADRFSAACIDASRSDKDKNLETFAKQLWTDSAAYEQQACSSPRIIFWRGSDESLREFFDIVGQMAMRDSQPSLTRKNEQLVFSQVAGARNGAEIVATEGVCAVKAKTIDTLLDFHAGQWCFIVVTIKSLDDVFEHSSAKLQTLSYAGFDRDTMERFAKSLCGQGIDRIVPLGQALDFDLIWDGMDLFGMLMRHIVVK